MGYRATEQLNFLLMHCRLEHMPRHQGSLQQPLLHMASATANQACCLLALSALDLARFGPQLLVDMQEYAAQRLQWRHHRMHVCKSAAQVHIIQKLMFYSLLNHLSKKNVKFKCLLYVWIINHHAIVEWVSAKGQLS